MDFDRATSSISWFLGRISDVNLAGYARGTHVTRNLCFFMYCTELRNLILTEQTYHVEEEKWLIKVRILLCVLDDS